MANTFAVSRNHLIFGLCLPLAVLLGYLLAEPLDSSSMAVVVMVLSVLCVPIMIKWHHPILILSWNAMITPYFLPGRPQLWMIVAFVSLGFGILGRSVSVEKKFLYVPSIVKPLVCFLGVVLVTAAFTGGIGVRSLGSETYGGRNYFYIIAAVIGYFALISRPIPQDKAFLYLAMFFLPTLTALVSNIAYYFPKIWFLYELFPASLAMDQAASEGAIGPTVTRVSGLIWAMHGVQAFLLARYGIRGIFDISRPWRLIIFSLACFASLFGGFRSAIVLSMLILGTLFIVEGLWRTKFLFVGASMALLAGFLIVGFADRLPLSAQRALSFLPLDLDPMVKLSAQSSTEWRLNMWKQLLPEVPNYLLKGKGYALNGRDVELLQNSAFSRAGAGTDWAAFSGDYHNGPLSLIFPFGLYGVMAFLWLLCAGVRLLARNYKYGHPDLRRINGFLLALFVARGIFFFGVFGAVAVDLYYFTGILGFAVALNHGEARPEMEWEETMPELAQA